MADDNAFTRILNRMSEADDSVNVKTASAAPADKTAEVIMLETVRSVANNVAKTASANTPAASLENMAKQAHDAEQEILTKQASAMGAALADGFMERYAQYDAALSSVGVKTAADNGQLEKAAQFGYTKAVADMEKTAAEDYERGYTEQLQAVHKIASEVHYAGQAVANSLIGQLKK